MIAAMEKPLATRTLIAVTTEGSRHLLHQAGANWLLLELRGI
jgi:hypothetical protein